MANSIYSRLELDGPRRAVVRIVGVLDTENLSVNNIVNPATFSVPNPNDRSYNGICVEAIRYSGTPGLVVQPFWNAATPQPIAALDGVANIDVRDSFFMTGDNTQPGYDGSINLVTGGFVPGRTMGFTLILHLIKRYS